MKTVVDRRKWLRGIYAKQASCLLNSDGMRCCLGFRAKARGLNDDAMLNLAEPACLYNAGSLDGSQLEKDSWLVDKEVSEHECEDDLFYSSNAACHLMQVNDKVTMLTDEEREKIITEIFNRNGEEIEFIGPRLPIVNGEEVRYEDASEVVDES